VSLESTNPVAPFATWATAATNIQDAVDTSKDGDTVLLTNGVHAVGERGTVVRVLCTEVQDLRRGFLRQHTLSIPCSDSSLEPC
jgi:hypothetical protein